MRERKEVGGRMNGEREGGKEGRRVTSGCGGGGERGRVRKEVGRRKNGERERGKERGRVSGGGGGGEEGRV